MARAYVIIKCKRGEIRKYGGNVFDVRCMQKYYINMNEADFINKHPYLTKDDFASLKIQYCRNN